ncbi:HD domain-containing protein [Paraburkholderia acidipaludis]|uniref:HD domain-containing protein n=1 Tax=Paraburkholderia acidipaludis TaxID=660537 RepID=UPI0004873248|nr:HD domain-containing protein [Paraburkholderia acidipaludis]
MSRIIAGVTIPDGPLAQAASAAILASEPPILFRHSVRVFLFGALIGEHRALDFDPELLYVAALFHDVGLTDDYRDSHRRFEVDGAHALRLFLKHHRISQEQINEAWLAVALHTTFGIPTELTSLTALLAAGVETDLLGLHFDEVSEPRRRAVLQEYPRGTHFKELVIDTFAHGLANRPATTFGSVCADVLERNDPNYRRLNFCGLILGSGWRE